MKNFTKKVKSIALNSEQVQHALTHGHVVIDIPSNIAVQMNNRELEAANKSCPIGKVGTHLQIRERFSVRATMKASERRPYQFPYYAADEDKNGVVGRGSFGRVFTQDLAWLGAEVMPLKHSRLTVVIASILFTYELGQSKKYDRTLWRVFLSVVTP